MQNSKDIDEERRVAQAHACRSIEAFVRDLDNNGNVNIYTLSVAAYHAGRARALFEVQDQVVDRLEDRLRKKTPPSTGDATRGR